MNESKKNIEINNGWILCPSKSFPGKFYYFNVVNGETAWSQNQAEIKGLKKESNLHTVEDIAHRYPEPTSLPDESTITFDNIPTKTKKPDFPQTIPQPIQLPTFGQVSFPNYVPNIEPIVPNVVWTLVPMLCPETKKPMFAKVDPTMEFERELFSHSSNIPLCKRFKNFEKYSKFETSTPKNSFLECVPEPKSFPPKSPIKEPILKLEQKLPTSKLPDAIKSFENTVLSLSSKVESTKISTEVPKVFEKEPVLENLERNDLRYVLLSKRKSFGAADTAVERKKPKADEIKPRTPKKKVTFNLEDETGVEALDDNSFIPLTPNLSWSTIESPKSPFKLKDKIPPSFVKETYETPPKNVKDLTPNYQQIPTKQLPTFELNAMKQISTSQQNTTNQGPTFLPTPTKQLPTFQLSTTKQTSTGLQNVTNQTSTFPPIPTKQQPTFQLIQKQLLTGQQTSTNQPPTFQPTSTNHLPTSTNQLPTFQFTQKQLPTSQQNATNQGSTFQPTATNQPTTFKNTTWYVVADTDVLLLDYDFIEKLVLSDPKCRLVIPHMVVSDIEALCLGDCRGQQRVINARQLTRKLATPPPYCIVEPRTSTGDLFVTTDCILHCCMKALNRNYYVVLITNDPHLLIRATTLNIHAYKLNEIQYGVDISPKALEQKSTQKTNTVNNTATNTEKLLNQKGSLFSNFNEKSEEKIIKMPAEMNKNIRSPIKPLCLSSDSETVTSDDILINITKPKSIENIENDTNSIDSDCTSDIFISNIQLNDKKVLKPQNVAKNPFHLQNGFVNFEKRILNPNAVFKTNNLEIKIPNENSIKNVNNSFENDYLDYNFENKDEFYSVPITNIADSVSENSSSNKCLKLRQSALGTMNETTIRNPSQVRIEKIMNAINTDSLPINQLDSYNTNAKETTAVFKIPKLLPIKSKTKNKSVLGEMSNANVKIGTNTSIDNVDQSLKKFRINNKFMRAKLNARSEEWICTYMQILEDFLVNLLQKNKMCMENTVAPLTIKDTLNCIKMLYDAHTKVRDVINKLSELLEKYMIGVQGQFKMPVGPEDFMKIFGCGVLLVQALEDILPLNEDLAEAKSRLKALHNNLQSYAKESDPELVKSPYSSRTDKNDEEIRPPFFKNPSYVLDYLKKHFKEWETYKERSDEQNHKIENHTDFTVVRTLGKNLNLLKFDKLKNMSLTNITEEKDLLNTKQEYKIMRQLDNNLIEANNENVETKTNIETKLIRLNDKEKNTIIFDYNSEENFTKNQKITPVNKTNEQKQNLESKDDGFNYSRHENTFLQENMEKDDTKVIRNAKTIEEFENKVVTREPLDLDLLDYSEIYEPSIDKNVDFDVLSETNKNTEIQNNFDVNNTINCDIETPVFTLEDFYITPSLSPESDKNNKNIDDSKITEINESIENINSVHNVTSSYFNIETENNNVTSTNKEDNIEKNNSEIESETFTEKQNSNNDSCIENDNSEKLDNSETRNYDSGNHNYDIGKTSRIVQDDSINDSGFENDSTYAHTLLKVFLKELCSTFTVIHTFINKFIDEISETELSAKQMNVYHNQASKALEDMVAIINHLKAIIKRESPEDTVLKMLLRNAGVEAAADKRMMRYRAIVIKCLEQAKILESALKIIVSTTIGDFDALSTNTENLHPDFRYFNIFEPNHQPFVGNT